MQRKFIFFCIIKLKAGKLLITLFLLSSLCMSCEWKLKPLSDKEEGKVFAVQRYDRLESLYLTTGDFSALQQMETDYPMETRTLIENVLKLGVIDDHEINNRFLAYFQNATLQSLISDAEAQYANMDDINQQLDAAFTKLRQHIPDMPIPVVYTQITSLDQSIVIGDGMVGISLDKYLGKDYELYKLYYSEQQRSSMNRYNIVPDCLCFYLISLYQVDDFESRTQEDRDLHMGKVMWMTNFALGKKFFKTKYVNMIDTYMVTHPSFTIDELLKMNDYTAIKNQ